MKYGESSSLTTVYNLQGQRLDEDAQNAGIYIKSGRKVVVK
jgi:hypothetical protein